MNVLRNLSVVSLPMLLVACAADHSRDTLADLKHIEPDLQDVVVEDSLARAEASYRRYLAETPSSVMAPEAMRRMADLQIEKQFGIIGSGELIEKALLEDRLALQDLPSPTSGLERDAPVETAEEFERRAEDVQQLPGQGMQSDLPLPADIDPSALAGPLEAIAIYQRILSDYPDYERNDQVLYQMSRAYDELGRPEEAMAVMRRLVDEYPDSRYIDEVHFRRGEYFFVRKKYLDAEEAYLSIIAMGGASSYYELALYKLGWALYKQELYEEALHRYLAMLDYRLSIGHDFDVSDGQDDEHRVADTFRVISLSFSNLGGPEVIDEYFAANGAPGYADRIYSNLGEFYLEKLRYQDAAAVYKSFIELNPYHRVAPNFSMRVVEIYEKGEFPKLVVASKKEFASRYALQSPYWQRFDPAEAPQVMGFLKKNLTDLATHYHALYQDEAHLEQRAENYREALTWYGQFLASFPSDEQSPAVNYRLADLLLQNEDFARAAGEYERTAYEYPPHERAAAAGYAAVYAHRQHLEGVTGAERAEARRLAVDSSLRFADTFPDHEKSPAVLGAAADDLYDMHEYERAIQAAQTLIERYPGTEPMLRRSAWIVVAHSSIDLARYPEAEQAYLQVLSLTPGDDEKRPAVIDGLAASIYKQGEQAGLLEDYRASAAHFLRIKDAASGSAIGVAAQYDAAAALMKLQAWSEAAGVLERFREENPGHELAGGATRQLALVYREDGQLARSAEEHERMAAESDDPQFSAEALLVAADLYEKADSQDRALAVYERYVAAYPTPVVVALETRDRMAQLYKARGDEVRYAEQLTLIVDGDRHAGPERSERTRYLAARAALVLSENLYRHFADLRLVQPFEQSLAEKQTRMDRALAEFERLVEYEVAEVTAAATYYIAEIYFEFSTSIMQSERPADLSDAELNAYQMVLEEEAYPFEEQSLGVHEQNAELLGIGVYNRWVQKSLDKLAHLMPARYARNEISSGFLASIDFYAYRMPIAPAILPGGTDAPQQNSSGEQDVEQQPGGLKVAGVVGHARDIAE